MKDLSMHMMYLVQNSLAASATRIDVEFLMDVPGDQIILRVKDNGKGMDPESLAQASDPFFTSRTTRKVGMGLPLFRQYAEMTGGAFRLESVQGQGTIVEGSFGLTHPDRQPFGDIGQTLALIISSNPELDFNFLIDSPNQRFRVETSLLRKELGEVSLAEPAVYSFLKDWIHQEFQTCINQFA